MPFCGTHWLFDPTSPGFFLSLSLSLSLSFLSFVYTSMHIFTISFFLTWDGGWVALSTIVVFRFLCQFASRRRLTLEIETVRTDISSFAVILFFFLAVFDLSPPLGLIVINLGLVSFWAGTTTAPEVVTSRARTSF